MPAFPKIGGRQPGHVSVYGPPKKIPMYPTARCPMCGFKNVLPDVGESLNCASCGIHLARKNGDKQEFVVVSEKTSKACSGVENGEGFLSEAEAEEMWKRNHPEE